MPIDSKINLLPLLGLLALTPSCGDKSSDTETSETTASSTGASDPTDASSDTAVTTDTTEATTAGSSTEATTDPATTDEPTTDEPTTDEPTTDEPTTDTTDTTDEPTTDTTDTTDDTSDTDPTDTTDTGGVDQDPPQNGAELLPWLEGGAYKGWKAESAPHPSTGPHFGTVRTYINDVLFESLESMNQEHPMGAAAIKELYGDGDTVLGWSVEVKFQANSDGGNGWYWYENYNGNVFADGDGVALCYGCHAAGNDYFRSPYPLQ